jgi:LPS sulfotransferase NodH
MGCPLEYFHVGFRPALAARWQVRRIGDFVRAVHRHRTDPGGVLSVKLFWRDIEDLAREIDPACFANLHQSMPEETSPEVYRALAAMLAPLFPAPELVHLFRRDRVRQAVSAVAATQTGTWRSIPDIGDQPARTDPSFDFDRLEKLVAYSDFCHGHWRNFFAAIGEAPYSLSYEDLAADYARSVAGVFDHLGSGAPPPSVRMRRQADARSEALVLQFLRQNSAGSQHLDAIPAF